MHKRKIILATGLLISSIVLAKESLAQWDAYTGTYSGTTGFDIDYTTSPTWSRSSSTLTRPTSGTTNTTTPSTSTTSPTSPATGTNPIPNAISPTCATPNYPQPNPQGTRSIKINDFDGKVFYASPPYEEVKAVRAFPQTETNIYEIIFDSTGKQIDEKKIGEITVDNKCYPKYGHITPPGSPPPASTISLTGCKNKPEQIVNSDPGDRDFRKVKIMDSGGTLLFHPEQSWETEGTVPAPVKVDFADKSFYVEVDGAKRMVGTFIYDDATCYPQYGYIVPSYVEKYTAKPEVKEEQKKDEPRLEEKKPVEIKQPEPPTETKLEHMEKRRALESAKTQKPKVFVDVATNTELRPALEQALNLGLIPEARKFRPKRKMNRCDFAKLALTAAAVPLDDSYAGEFKDVPADSEFAAYVNTAARLGILPPRRKKLYGCRKFVTRAEAEAAIAVGTGSPAAETSQNKAKEKLTRAEIIQMIIEAFGTK